MGKFRRRGRRRYSYFNRCRCVQMWFDSIGKQLQNLWIRSWACHCCIHRTDTHMMNCLECCPCERTLENLYDRVKNNK